MRRFSWSALSAEEKNRLLRRPALEERPGLGEAVRGILAEVRAGRDKAVLKLTEAHDRVRLSRLQVTPKELEEAKAQVDTVVLQAMKRAVAQLETFHRAQLPKTIDLETSPGIRCQRQWRAVERVGLYVPAGSAPLPSTVLMLGVPSALAGCGTRVLCSPPRFDGTIDPHILVAAALCGITTIFKIGGAQAVAAMAYGTESVPKVDKIFGPGNAWVTQAKIQVAQDPEGAAYDMPAGPSEVLVLADATADPDFVAADLLSQAEHGADSQVVLVATDSGVITEVEKALAAQLEKLPRHELARQALEKGFAVEVRDVAEALDVSNAYAPEHLIVQLRDPGSIVSRIQNAGSVFLGPWSPESVGDYASGTNHVLPTYGFARTYGGLSVESFLKQITFQELTENGLRDIGPVVETLAAIEGLEAHRQAVSLRLAKLGRKNRGDARE